MRLLRPSPDDVNEALVVDGRVHGARACFLVDTGHAGPMVLSRTYLGCPPPPYFASLQRAYSLAIAHIDAVDADAKHAGLTRFMRRGACHAYTSGCKMRLMGIGATHDQHSDMLLCAPVAFRSLIGVSHTTPRRNDAARADVFVTSDLSNHVHILTSDYLHQMTPVVLRPRAEQILFRASWWSTSGFVRQQAAHHGGAWVIGLTVQGRRLNCTLDTGSPAPLCLARDQLPAGLTPTKRSIVQQGIHADAICCDLYDGEVECGGVSFSKVSVFAHDSAETRSVDGFVGMAFLRAFDMLLLPSSVGLRPNGLLPRTSAFYDAASRPRTCRQ